jgi:hypothetical protein
MNKTADNDKIVGRLVADYKAIIEHYRQNIAIPQDLLFKLEKQ